MDNTLNGLTLELDNAVGLIGLHVETLNDIETVFGQLKEDMDTAELKSEGFYYYREHAREVRILSKLMYYVMKELNEVHEKTSEIQTEIFRKVREGGDKQ